MRNRNMWLVARREFVTRGKSGGYLITTAFLAAVLLLTTVAPALFDSMGKDEPLQILLLDKTGQVAAPLHNTLQAAAAEPGGRAIRVETVDGEEQAMIDRARTENKAIVIVDGTYPSALSARYMASAANLMTQSGVVLGPLQSIVRTARLKSRGLDDSVMQEILEPLKVDTMQITATGEGRDQKGFMGSMLVALGVVMVLYMVILINGQFVFQGVLEEKVSRVVEVMAASVGPSEMLAGKVIGLGGLGLAQFVAMMLAWTGGTLVANKMSDIPTQGVAMGPAVLAFVFMVLGYLLSATMMAAAASTISRMEDSTTVLMPITMLIALPFMLLAPIIGDPNGSLAVVLSMIPFFSQSIMVLRVLMTEVPVWQVAVSLGLLLVSTLFMVWAGGRIYRVALLSYGARPSFRTVMGYLSSK